MKNKLKRGERINPSTVFLAASALLVHSTFAQSPAVTNSVADTATTNLTAMLKLPKSLSLTYGAFDFHPRLVSSTVYEDNILSAATGKESDVISKVSPGIQVLGGDRETLKNYLYQKEFWQYDFNLMQISPSYLATQPSESWPGKYVLMDYAFQWQEFASHPANDSFDQFLNMNAVIPLSKLVLGFKEEYNDVKEVLIGAATRTEVQKNQSEVDAAYQLSEKLSLESAFVQQSFCYPDNAGLQGYSEYKGSVALNNQVDSILNVGLAVAGGLDEVDSGQNQQFLQIGGQSYLSYHENFLMRVSGGAEWRQFDTGRTDVFTPYVKLSGIYNLPERTYMMIEISRQQFASLFNGSYYTQTGGHLSLRKYLTNRLSLLVDLSCYDFNYSSTAINGKTSSVTDYYAIQIGSSAKLYKNIYCELYYQYSGNNLFHNGAPATCNHIAINLGLKL